MCKVSVLIPNYNHEVFLRQRIRSVLDQTFGDFEVIILDDCSTDGSEKILDEFKNENRVSRIVYNKNNSGSTFRQWNKGVELCNAEIVWIAESDDFAHPNMLSEVVTPMLLNENIGISYCQSYKVNDKNEVTGNWKDHTDDLSYERFSGNFEMSGIEYIRQFLVHRNTIPNASAVLFRKKFYQLSGGAEPEIKNCSDWLTWLKILLLSDVSFVAKPLNYFRYHEQSVIARASKNRDYTKYTGPQDRLIRKRLDEYLRNNYSEERKVIELNRNHILKDYGDEGLFDINHKRILKGWTNLVKTLSLNEHRFSFIRRGVKQTIKQMIRL